MISFDPTKAEAAVIAEVARRERDAWRDRALSAEAKLAEQAALLEEVRGDLNDAVRSFAECAESLSDRVRVILAKLQPDTGAD